jgi:hypothetical protein
MAHTTNLVVNVSNVRGHCKKYFKNQGANRWHKAKQGGQGRQADKAVESSCFFVPATSALVLLILMFYKLIRVEQTTYL